MSDIVERLLASAEHSERCGWLTHALLDREAARTITEAAAFLDGLAARVEDWHEREALNPRLIDEAAADCRALAAKLRGQ